MTSESALQSATNRPARGLRAVMGVRLPSGWCPVEGSQVAWQQIPESDSQSALSAQLQPIVCLHSAGSGSREFHPLLEHRPVGSRLILIDWPGHGRSESPQTQPFPTPLLERSVNQLHAVLNQLGLRRPILLGSGFSAAVAIRYAATNPTRILGLALCQPAGLIPPGRDKFSRKTRSSAPLSPAERQILRVEAIRPEMQPILTEAETSLDRSQSSLREILSSIRCPILFALSRESKAYPLKKYLGLLDPLLAASPQHTFTVFNGSLHPIWDEPVRFAQALTGFVQAQLPLHQHQHAWLLTAVDWPAADTNLWKCVHPACPEEKILPTGQNPNEVTS